MLMRITRSRFVLLVFAALFSGVSHDEGGSCPAGYYPIGGGAASGCAPIPNYGGDGGGSDQHVPQVRWAKTWGAVAVDKSTATVGAVVGKMTKRLAQKSAVMECQVRGGGAGCSNVAVTYRNQCAAMAWGLETYVTAHAETIELASNLAMSGCREVAEDCRIYYSACSEPVRIQ